MKKILKTFFKGGTLECGLDEVGRGALCGPVVAAAVIMPDNFDDFDPDLPLHLIQDSKKLTEKQRNEAKELIEYLAIDYSVAFVENERIDKIGILNSSIFAMHQAVQGLSVVPELLLVDGTQFKAYKTEGEEVPHVLIEKGDSKYLSIAAASILAKIARDAWITKKHTEFPVYNWSKNKGYGTKEHYSAIKEYGISPLHRKSFNLH